MDPAMFWHLIDSTRPPAWEPREHLDRLDKALRSLDLGEVLSWMGNLGEAIDGARRHDLADAYSVAEGLRYVGDDGFGDFIQWLILQGKATYEGVLEEPDELATFDIRVSGCARLCNLAEDIFLEQTGGLPAYKAPRYHLRGQAIRDENELRRKYPRLWEKGMTPPTQRPLEELLESMRDSSNPFFQAHSAFDVWERTGDTSLVLPILAPLLESQMHNARAAAARFIGLTGAAACHLVEPLRRLIHDEHFLVRRNAVIALGCLGPCARAAAADIRTFCDANVDPDRRYASQALARIEGP